MLKDDRRYLESVPPKLGERSGRSVSKILFMVNHFYYFVTKTNNYLSYCLTFLLTLY